MEPESELIRRWGAISEAVLESWDPVERAVLNPVLVRLLGDPAGRAVLDAGAGQGYLSRKLAVPAQWLTALEPAGGPLLRGRPVFHLDRPGRGGPEDPAGEPVGDRQPDATVSAWTGRTRKGVSMQVRPVVAEDVPALLRLAGQVEQWFGPMVDNPDFRAALDRAVSRDHALAALDGGDRIVGGLFFTGPLPGRPDYRIDWLVVDEQTRGSGWGRALVEECFSRLELRPCEVTLVTFGPDHPGVLTRGARAFYAALGFTAGGGAPAGPEGGSRQVFSRPLPA